MESVKSGLFNFCKGFCIWFILLLLNTHSGEANVNSLKIVLDMILAVILVSDYKIGRYIALVIAALTAVITILPLPSGLEILLLIGIVVLGGILLKTVPEDAQANRAKGHEEYRYTFSENSQLSWKSRNFFNPFETYFYSSDSGINIRKGMLRRSYSTIPTTTTRARIYQSIWQRLLGLCDVSFQTNDTGQQFGEDSLQNIRFKAAMKLMQMLP